MQSNTVLLMVFQQFWAEGLNIYSIAVKLYCLFSQFCGFFFSKHPQNSGYFTRDPSGILIPALEGGIVNSSLEHFLPSGYQLHSAPVILRCSKA